MKLPYNRVAFLDMRDQQTKTLVRGMNNFFCSKYIERKKVLLLY